MIKEFVEQWEKRKHELKEIFSKRHPEDYEDLVREVIKILIESYADDDPSNENPDPKRIHQIDDGHYQGTLLFVIAAQSYQPSDYWYVFVGYGSCSGCDTLEGIKSYDDDAPSESQTEDYMTLCLHIIQKLKKMDDEEEEDKDENL